MSISRRVFSVGVMLFLTWFTGLFTAVSITPAHYALESKLAQGQWIKVSVAATGMHRLSFDDLKRMGFSDPTKVKVFGYGGGRLPDILEQSTYIDDLPAVPTVKASDGILFYAVGPEETVTDIQGNLYLTSNPFSLYGYYFLTDRDDLSSAELSESGNGNITTGVPASSFVQTVQHETDAVSPGETGHYLVGEDLRSTPSRSFRFTLPDRVPGTTLKVGVSLFTNLVSGSSWELEVNGHNLRTTALPATSSANNVHGDISTVWVTPDNLDGTELTVTVTLNGNPSNVRKAWLDRITVNYVRQTVMPSDGTPLLFESSAPLVQVSSTTPELMVLDVTDPLEPKNLKTESVGTDNTVVFSNGSSGQRSYVAFDPSSTRSLPSPAFVERVSTQNLHAMQGLDMVIVSPEKWNSAAKRLAAHRQAVEGMDIAVVDPTTIYNEFSSGVPDVNAIRKFLKMLHDRSGGEAPKYLLLFGRSTFDNRHLTAASANLGYETLPLWQTDHGYNDNYSYPSDDILGFLADGSGRTLASDTLSLAIGRLPVTSLSQANLMVDKIIAYEQSSPQGLWRAKAVFIADDDDNGIHMQQTETMLEALAASPHGDMLLPGKIYIDSYEYTNGIATGARDDLYRSLDEGALWLNYVGHASPTALSSEGIVNYSDMGSLYLDKVPFIYAATCDFLKWDSPSMSGAERLALTKGGGVIGAISATRPVYITQNGLLTQAMGRFMTSHDTDGQVLPLGDILRLAKNSVVNDDNKLRYVLLGDPSMRLLMPQHTIRLEKLAGADFPGEEDVVVQARQDFTLEGSVRHAVTGELLDTFNGTVRAVLYDADESVTTLGHGTSGTEFIYDRHGNRLFAGTDTVTAGRFTLDVAMPSEVADNYRNATLLLYAEDKDSELTASAVERQLYVYGTDEEALPDTIPPVIETIYLNHPSFVNGNIVNASPMLIADVSDNHAINMSMAGIGHWMSLSLDNGAVTYNDVSDYYESQSVQRGTIYYPLTDLDEGYHTLTLRVWDASGNSASATVEFYVDRAIQPQVFDIYTDRNPASETASFYLVHDRPDGNLKVEFMIYDMLGRTVWTNTSTGRSDKYRSYPITWNLTDTSGRRVARGIYLYRAVVTDMGGSASTDGLSSVTPTKKIAVTSR